jgi:hypothetical protein
MLLPTAAPAAPPTALPIAVLAALSAATVFANSRPLHKPITHSMELFMSNHSEQSEITPVWYRDARLSRDVVLGDATGLAKHVFDRNALQV